MTLALLSRAILDLAYLSLLITTCLCFCSTVTPTAAYNTNQPKPRRAFLSNVASSAIASAVVIAADPTQAANAATGGSVSSAQAIKVTPISHTFVVSKGIAKPLRENDATRILTNAKVVFVFEGEEKEENAVGQLLELVAMRKSSEGAGVTPGKMKLVIPPSSAGDTPLGNVASQNNIEIVKVPSSDYGEVLSSVLGSSSDGDVLFMSPQPSKGTSADARIVAECASALRLDVGGGRGGGVVSVLVNGPRAPNTLNIVEDGFETCSVLWYDV
mmetsp:Transcript_54387/g.80693  ORF Transcript_54387/g.80693 Transcript_54387/m.80693 type:complete len:272 (+) Transcript_54387:29-844(+)|eukprot:CAMPEP_0195513970 /NCGR_PEP_ID=MMETSP0794_2-20130614/5505_1 /TAXON_ID=515487 /ORGANISM="Stephanopyxis turris, Strain CCMP 815" /LENGTH=271 /DNA_ID=CAMNT_0040642113 /DNA_START=19 /DNA_END=834 /DNA_ORIENTATION=-